MREKKHIRVYDLNMNLVAILENAYKIGYEVETNNLWRCWFTLPLNDPKKEEVTVKRFIELYDHDKYIGKFVINPKRTIKNENTREITFECEHVLSLLHSDVLFGYHQYTNYTTKQVLEGLLEAQETRHWQLGTVEFTRYFHYAWEHEDSLLNALFSVPKPFDESYIWTWDDTKYPFTLNLVRPSDVKVDVVRAGKNLKGIEIEVDPTNIINRIYPLGYGEGVNQLTIKEVNGGVEYLEDSESIQKYGLQKKIWVDRRFEDPDSLKASAQAFLDKYKEPLKTVAIDLIDYRHLDPYKVLDYNVGDIIGVYDEDTDTNTDLRIMKIKKNDIYGNPFDIQMEIGNVRENIGITITDLQKKQLVNDTYSQGSTNILAYSYNDNCSPTHPVIIKFYIPDDVVNINTLDLTFETTNFRAYSRATKGGGATIVSTTTAAGGGTSTTTAAGGGTTTTTASGGGTSTTTAAGGNHTHLMFAHSTQTTTPGSDTWHEYYAYGDANQQSAARVVIGGTLGGDLYTRGSSGNHTHSFSTDPHTHSFTLDDHTHNLTLNPHTHEVSVQLPDHTHDIQHEIYILDELPTSVTIKVDGNTVTYNSTSGENIDLIPYLSKDDSGRIQRGRWATVEIYPNSLGRINANVISRLFIQSRKGITI